MKTIDERMESIMNQAEDQVWSQVWGLVWWVGRKKINIRSETEAVLWKIQSQVWEKISEK